MRLKNKWDEDWYDEREVFQLWDELIRKEKGVGLIGKQEVVESYHTIIFKIL